MVAIQIQETITVIREETADSEIKIQTDKDLSNHQRRDQTATADSEIVPTVQEIQHLQPLKTPIRIILQDLVADSENNHSK